MATILGFLYSFAWTTSSPGTKTLLVFTIILQLSGVIWTGWYTANDRIDGVQNFVVYVLECTATCLVLASALVAGPGKSSPDSEVDLLKLADSLSLVVLSGSLLLAAVFFPMCVMVYNSFLVPVCHLVWGKESPWSMVIMQIIMTLLLLPMQIMNKVLGTGSGNLELVFEKMEGSLLEVTASTTGDLAAKNDADDCVADNEEKAGLSETGSELPSYGASSVIGGALGLLAAGGRSSATKVAGAAAVLLGQLWDDREEEGASVRLS